MSNKVTFSQLIEELSEKTNTSQALSNNFVSQLTDLVIETSVESGKASITNFGSFKVIEVAARNGVNPQTGESIVIPAHQRLSFTPYKSLENKVNSLYADLEATFVVEEEKVVPPIFKNPEKESGSSRTTPIMLAIVFVLLAVVAGVWYFVFRDSNATNIAQEIPAEVEQPVEAIPPIETPMTTTEADESAVQPEITEQVIADELPIEAGLVVNAPLGISSHMVRQGEWFYDIARTIYKTPVFWPLIFEANFTTSQDPDILKPGKQLAIPSIENPQNPTANDRKKLANAAVFVSKAYTNSGKTSKALEYERMARHFMN
ncbi:MAG: HU family DNA-binding protein [Balneolaceae bacterium]